MSQSYTTTPRRSFKTDRLVPEMRPITKGKTSINVSISGYDNSRERSPDKRLENNFMLMKSQNPNKVFKLKTSIFKPNLAKITSNQN